jgi:hypothetical protein
MTGAPDAPKFLLRVGVCVCKNEAEESICLNLTAPNLSVFYVIIPL